MSSSASVRTANPLCTAAAVELPANISRTKRVLKVTVRITRHKHAAGLHGLLLFRVSVNAIL